MSTNEELKDELLRVYRFLFTTVAERDHLRQGLLRAKRERKESQALLDEECEISDRLRERNRALDDENNELTLESFNYHVAADATLDLVGAVIDQEAMGDMLEDISALAFRPLPLPVLKTSPTPTMDVRDETGMTREPARCLSCGEEKGTNYYFCEMCFELAQDLELDLFAELSSAWDKGARDFPRPGKNAKTTAPAESVGER